MTTIEKNPILSAETARRKLRRMAFEIAERNDDCRELVIAGVSGNGIIVAQHLVRELQTIYPCTIDLVTIHLNKKQPLEARIEGGTGFDGKTVIVVDDVADSGRTLLYAVKPFLSFQPKGIQTLVLVERSHKQFPVQSDYVGLSVATTLQEHISVETADGDITGAWLH
ncbi:MAG TPA: phosphoribosyltransferase family protein [Chitinophagaceae bacterium]|jgi:pyrimidine operon attenuation protein/uracil phosphoribosyltransferase|nr:phosphoribosyltransferase family protein [Chitinophagaceae bacterium]